MLNRDPQFLDQNMDLKSPSLQPTLKITVTLKMLLTLALVKTNSISVAMDFWLGVHVGRQTFAYDQDPSLRTPLQVESNNKEKSFADGTPFNETIHHNFGFLLLKTWIGPCLVAKRFVDYKARDTACRNSYAFFCKWSSEQYKSCILSSCFQECCPLSGVACPHGYKHLGSVDEARRCTSVLELSTSQKPESCQMLSQDKLRNLTVFKSKERLEKVRELQLK